MAERKRLDLGNLNPIYEGELNKLDVSRLRGGGMCLEMGREAKDVGISIRWRTRYTSPLSRARGLREVSATCDSDGGAEADGGLVFPEILRPAPGEGIGARLIFPLVGKVLQGAPMGMHVEEAQELPVNPTRGQHDTRQKAVCGARQKVGICLAVSCHLGACCGLAELVGIGVAHLPVAAHVPEVVAA